MDDNKILFLVFCVLDCIYTGIDIKLDLIYRTYSIIKPRADFQKCLQTFCKMNEISDEQDKYIPMPLIIQLLIHVTIKSAN